MNQKEFLGFMAGLFLFAILFTEESTQIWRPFLFTSILFTALWYFKK